jgi:glucose/arabinose dehydrogenase
MGSDRVRPLAEARRAPAGASWSRAGGVIGGNGYIERLVAAPAHRRPERIYHQAMRSLLLAMALVGSLSSAARAGLISDPGFVDSEFVVSDQLNAATGLAWAPDGSNRLFVARKTGEIVIIKNGQLLPAPFATLTPVYTASECGLVGIAFDPDFLSNHYLYAFATVIVDSKPVQQIIRYTADGDTGVDKKVLVDNLPTRGANHDGGAVGVGPDGKLYWAVGDNGSNLGVNDDLTTLGAKVGRANRDGTAPSDNPFHDGSGGPRDFIWARGVRNPFTFTFQPATGLLWVNVVGTLYEQIFVVRKGDHAGWIDQEVNQRPPNIRPVIKYRTNDKDVISLQPADMGGAVRKQGVVTFSTAAEHFLRPGERITVAGVTDASFNGVFFVASVPTATSFTVAQAGPDATSGSAGAQPATATTTYMGGCVVGGEFYDSSAVPAPYRGNLFFGDYNSGLIFRAIIDPASNAVTSVDLWAHDLGPVVDVALGPDGALYYVGTATKRVRRGAYQPTTQGLVVTPLHLWTAEKQSRVVNVHLAMAPAAEVTVTVARADGDADISVSAGATLTFTPSNWNVPQTATIAAATDADNLEDQATIAVSAPGLTSENVVVHARDDLAAPPEDAAIVEADAGAPDASVDAALAGTVDAAGDGAGATGSEASLPGADAADDVVGADTGPAVADAATDAARPSLADAGADLAAAGDSNGAIASSGSCSCRLGGRSQGGGPALALLLVGLLVGRRARTTTSR